MAARLLGALREGNRRAVAARLAGVSEPTLYRWLGDERAPYREFREAFLAAEAEAEAAAVATVRRASLRDARYATWFLENRSPEWRQHRLLPQPYVQASEPEPEARTRVVVISQELLEQYALEALGPIATPPLEVRARLVEDYFDGKPVVEAAPRARWPGFVANQPEREET